MKAICDNCTSLLVEIEGVKSRRGFTRVKPTMWKKPTSGTMSSWIIRNASSNVSRRSSPVAADALSVGGFEPFSTQDWPGRLAAVVFVQGCPWRCSYCHNPGLQSQCAPQAGLRWADLRARWRTRIGLLDGLVFSGGEPTLDPALPSALAEVREAGLATALHTAGVSAAHLSRVLPLLDWVALDIKAAPPQLPALTGAPGSVRETARALQLVQQSGVAYELRTTWHPRWLPEPALLMLADWLASHGVQRWVLQAGRPPGGGPAAALAASWREALKARVPQLSFR